MRKEFFHLRPENSEFGRLQGTGTLARLPTRASGRISEADDGKAIIEKDEKGQPVFKVNKVNVHVALFYLLEAEEVTLKSGIFCTINMFLLLD